MTFTSRAPWTTYFMDGADWAAGRADCTRRRVGAIIVSRDHRVVATGYNGAPPGGPSCLKGQCPRGRLTTEEVAPGSSYDTGAGACIALHAEQNAVMYCSRDQRYGGTIYVTHPPCDGCLRMLQGSGLDHVVWRGEDGLVYRESLKVVAPL